MLDIILSIPFALGLVVGLAVHVLASWRVSKRTGQPLRAVILGGGPKPTGPV